MNPHAIPKARARLSEARAAIEEIVADLPDVPIFQDRWHTFLVKSCSIYSILEQASKGNGRSEAWFGRKKHERKKDPLLSYIHHARNTEQYSVVGSSERGYLDIISKNRYSKTITSKIPGRLPILIMTAGRPAHFQVLPPGYFLVSVKDDRYDDTFAPPNEHLGIPINHPDPVTVARLALAYIQGMVEEASLLASS